MPGVSMPFFVSMPLAGRQRHHALNDVFARSFASAEIPVSKEPTGIYRDSVTLVPYGSQAGP